MSVSVAHGHDVHPNLNARVLDKAMNPKLLNRIDAGWI